MINQEDIENKIAQEQKNAMEEANKALQDKIKNLNLEVVLNSDGEMSVRYTTHNCSSKELVIFYYDQTDLQNKIFTEKYKNDCKYLSNTFNLLLKTFRIDLNSQELYTSIIIKILNLFANISALCYGKSEREIQEFLKTIFDIKFKNNAHLFPENNKPNVEEKELDDIIYELINKFLEFILFPETVNYSPEIWFPVVSNGIKIDHNLLGIFSASDQCDTTYITEYISTFSKKPPSQKEKHAQKKLERQLEIRQRKILQALNRLDKSVAEVVGSRTGNNTENKAVEQKSKFITKQTTQKANIEAAKSNAYKMHQTLLTFFQEQENIKQPTNNDESKKHDVETLEHLIEINENIKSFLSEDQYKSERIKVFGKSEVSATDLEKYFKKTVNHMIFKGVQLKHIDQYLKDIPKIFEKITQDKIYEIDETIGSPEKVRKLYTIKDGVYHFNKLSPLDFRMPIIGKLSGCCQTYGDHGSEAARDSIINDRCGIYALEKANTSIDSKNKVFVQSLVWVSEDGKTFGIDSIEFEGRYKKYLNEIISFYQDSAIQILENNPNIEQIVVGGTEDHAKDKFFTYDASWNIKNEINLGYTDADTVRLVLNRKLLEFSKNEPEAFNILSNIQNSWGFNDKDKSKIEEIYKTYSLNDLMAAIMNLISHGMDKYFTDAITEVDKLFQNKLMEISDKRDEYNQLNKSLQKLFTLGFKSTESKRNAKMFETRTKKLDSDIIFNADIDSLYEKNREVFVLLRTLNQLLRIERQREREKEIKKLLYRPEVEFLLHTLEELTTLNFQIFPTAIFKEITAVVILKISTYHNGNGGLDLNEKNLLMKVCANLILNSNMWYSEKDWFLTEIANKGKGIALDFTFKHKDKHVLWALFNGSLSYHPSHDTKLSILKSCSLGKNATDENGDPVIFKLIHLLAFSNPTDYDHHHETQQVIDALKERIKDLGESMDVKDQEERTPLFYALRQQNYGMIRFLIEKDNVGLDTQCNGETALSMAIALSDIDTVEFLIHYGADVNGKNKNGNTPLSLALTNKDVNKEIIKLLEKHGAYTSPSLVLNRKLLEFSKDKPKYFNIFSSIQNSCNFNDKDKSEIEETYKQYTLNGLIAAIRSLISRGVDKYFTDAIVEVYKNIQNRLMAISDRKSEYNIFNKHLLELFVSGFMKTGSDKNIEIFNKITYKLGRDIEFNNDIAVLYEKDREIFVFLRTFHQSLSIENSKEDWIRENKKIVESKGVDFLLHTLCEITKVRFSTFPIVIFHQITIQIFHYFFVQNILGGIISNSEKLSLMTALANLIINPHIEPGEKDWLLTEISEHSNGTAFDFSFKHNEKYVLWELFNKSSPYQPSNDIKLNILKSWSLERNVRDESGYPVIFKLLQLLELSGVNDDYTHRVTEAIKFRVTHFGDGMYLNDKYGKTPLFYALKANHYEMVKFLIKQFNVNLNTQCKDTTPLSMAITHNDEETVEFLINHGANINHKHKHGDTPLSLALTNKDANKEIIKLLEKHGAKPNLVIQNNELKTPFIPAFEQMKNTSLSRPKPNIKKPTNKKLGVK